jgi:group I intron endonuclease
MVIYLVTNRLDGKQYIGQTIQSLKKRWAVHYAPKSECPYLHNAIQKYGKENFSVEEIATYSNLEDLNNAEEYYIQWYNTLAPNGYNISLGGANSGKMNEETKQKISIATKGKKKSPEMRAKLSASKMGAKHNMFGKPARNRQSIKCIETGIIYQSQRQLAKELNCSEAQVSKAFKNNYTLYGVKYIKVQDGR